MSRPVLKKQSERAGASHELCGEYADKLSQMINCRTVWTREGKYSAEFEKFYSILPKLFPLLTSKAKKLTFGGGCFFYVIEGESAERNILLMSHHDVVDGGEGWDSDPFTATEREGYLYGRGTIDTKTPLFAQLQAAEELIREGCDFRGIRLFIGSSNNEEVCGDGMVLAVEYFKENGIRFDTVLDEGGAITEGQLPGVGCKSAMIAVHEKSRHVFRLSARIDPKGHGGFGGAKDSAVERLSRCITEISDRASSIYKGRFYPEVKETFARHAKYMSAPMSFLFGNMGLFSPIIKKIMMGIPAASAMLSTSVSFTTLNAGDARDPQMRAKVAEATMFLRCVREEDLYAGLEKIRKIATRYGVNIEEVERDFCRPTDFCGDAYRKVEKILNRNFPDVAVAPFLLTAGTDARRFSDVADNILRFAPIDLSRQQFATIHGANENIGIKNIGECVLFYKSFVGESLIL